ncbi:MAG: hypothetical protein ACR2O6_06590 [Ilumatobacteraceae bacterium]
MVRMLESEKVLERSGHDVSVETPTEAVTPTAEEVRALVHGPRRPIRWMRWLGAAVLVIAAAMIVTFATRNDETDVVSYQTPTAANASAGGLTMESYLPVESSGVVYNYNPVTERLTMESYLPVESSGVVYNYNPVTPGS